MREDKPSAGAWKHPPRKRATGFPILFFLSAAFVAVPLGIVIGAFATMLTLEILDILNIGDGK